MDQLSRLERSAERRTAVRYEVSLAVELWPAARLTPMGPFCSTTRDMSIRGFYFFSDRIFEAGTRVKFRVVGPSEIAGGGPELVRGIGKCVRIEQMPGANCYGVGVLIEKVVRRQARRRAVIEPRSA